MSWLGVPDPVFGVSETRPTSGIVDVPAGTQIGTLPPGSVYRLLPGTHNVAGRTWLSQGTPSDPVFVFAEPGAVLTTGASGSPLKVDGSYLIWEQWEGLSLRVRLQPTAQHIWSRDFEIHGFPSPPTGAQSTGIYGFGAAKDCGVLGGYSHDNGVFHPDYQRDINAFSCSAGAERIYVLDTVSVREAGDSFRGGDNEPQPTPARYIYLSGDTFGDNGENPLDVKHSLDWVVSNCLLHDSRNSSSSAGEGVVVHYQAERIWLLNNIVERCVLGVITTGSIGLRVLGSHFEDCETAILIRGNSPDTRLYHNTVRRADVGIELQSPAEVPTEARYNILADCVTPIITTAGAVTTGNLVGDPLFAGPVGPALNPASPARDAAEEGPSYAEFEAAYGLDVRGGRPLGPAWDIGAYEIPSGGVAPLPATVTLSYEVTQMAVNVHVAWSYPPGAPALTVQEILQTVDGGAPATIPVAPTAVALDLTDVGAHVFTFAVRSVNDFGEALSGTVGLDTRPPVAASDLTVTAQVV